MAYVSQLQVLPAEVLRSQLGHASRILKAPYCAFGSYLPFRLSPFHPCLASLLVTNVASLMRASCTAVPLWAADALKLVVAFLQDPPGSGLDSRAPLKFYGKKNMVLMRVSFTPVSAIFRHHTGNRTRLLSCLLEPMGSLMTRSCWLGTSVARLGSRFLRTPCLKDSTSITQRWPSGAAIFH